MVLGPRLKSKQFSCNIDVAEEKVLIGVDIFVDMIIRQTK